MPALKNINSYLNGEDTLSPENYFHRFIFETNSASFIQMDRNSYRKSPFLDDRVECVYKISELVNLDEFLKLLDIDKEGSPCNFIFHTAYCCSTLLSRALDIDNKSLVYREPVTLHQIAVMKRRREQFSEYHINRWNDYLKLVIQMLSQTWDNNEASIIKATDSCNNIISNILSISEKSRAILLYSKLDDFIASNLKSEGRRIFLKNFVIRSYKDSKVFPLLTLIDPSSLNDARSAAYVWMTQMMWYQLASKNKRCRTLDAVHLLENPLYYLNSACKHFNIGTSEHDIANIIHSSVWNKHAKDKSGSSYNSNNRISEKNIIIKNNIDEINDAISWAYSFTDWDDCISALKQTSL